jgi:DNA-binding transcriptional LysR family regulator
MSWLLAFEAAARHLSFTRAAEELSLTQSAVSRHVQALEELLEVPLFRREGRQLELTEVGAMYLRELSGGLQRIRNASLQAIAYRTGVGSIHLASLPTFAAKWLLPRLNTFYETHPDILVHVHSKIGQFDLQLAGMDAAIAVGDGNWPGLMSHHLLDEHMILVASPKLMKRLPLNSPGDVAQHILLQVAARPDAWSQWFSTYQVPARHIRWGPQFEVTSHLIQSAVAGIGVGLVPSCLVEDELRNGTLVIPFDAPLITGLAYYLFVPPHRNLPPSLTSLKDWLLGQTGESPGEGLAHSPI